MTEHQVKKSQSRRLVEAIKKLPAEQANVFEQAILGAASMNDLMERYHKKKEAAA